MQLAELIELDMDRLSIGLNLPKFTLKYKKLIIICQGYFVKKKHSVTPSMSDLWIIYSLFALLVLLKLLQYSHTDFFGVMGVAGKVVPNLSET